MNHSHWALALVAGLIFAFVGITDTAAEPAKQWFEADPIAILSCAHVCQGDVQPARACPSGFACEFEPSKTIPECGAAEGKICIDPHDARLQN